MEEARLLVTHPPQTPSFPLRKHSGWLGTCQRKWDLPQTRVRAQSDPETKAPDPCDRPQVSLGVLVRTFFSLCSHFLCTSSRLPHPSLAPWVCCQQASPLSCLPVSTAIGHYLEQSRPGQPGRKPACDSPLFTLHPLPSPETKAKTAC